MVPIESILLLAVLLLPRSGRELLVRHNDCDFLTIKRDGMRVRKSRCWRPPLPGPGSTLCRAWVSAWLPWRDAQGAAAVELLAKTGFMVPLSRKIGPENCARSAARWGASSLAATVLSAWGTVPAADKAVVDRLGPTAAAPARAEFSTERAIMVRPIAD